MGDQCTLRLVRELRQVERSEQLAFTISYEENNIRDIQALIVGPPGTPYELGFYEFSIKIPPDYPANPPVVKIRTTNKGRTRFGPNLYANGKVDLGVSLSKSTMNVTEHGDSTWHGSRGEQWSPAQGLESVLLSIQSLLSANPYTLEPGFEDTERTNDTENMEIYKSKIRHENLRLAVITPLEQAIQTSPPRRRMPPTDGPSPSQGEDSDAEAEPDFSTYSSFQDFCKRRFLWYFEFYQNAIEKAIADEPRRQGTPFVQMPFEGQGNSMTGEWNYVDLKARLLAVRDQLLEETRCWLVEGLALVEEDAGIAVKLRGQREQIAAELSTNPQIIDLSLVDDNPFAWRLTYVGRNESRLEGGIIKIKIYISPRHPEEQPRAFVETPLYHIRVSKLGVLMYLPSQAEEMGHHIEGIISTLEDDNPPYNPLMTVNPEASGLCWGSELDRRVYRRKLRASLEES
ncbi:Ubiquitin-conjugating enzyme E2 [Penicillium paradoxum]|uniref:Ubiquitin-conjugating enzyme E2 n=1 Tax=Penicillium paradoxum TaxID=176176 RepID=UPI00254721ED|nr:Ubiquitin-conjugating enzyme E2 [Penicillium paradoxum]KAJ5781347.1 Ubiquitin-conjugating enzyme E2 [Penicillium paradoxum]